MKDGFARLAGHLRNLSLALASAGLLGLYSQHPALAFVPYFALVPWTILYSGERKPRAGLGLFALSAWASWILQLTVTFKYGWFAPLVMGAVWAVPWLPFVPLFRVIQRLRLPLTFTVPIVWTCVEWIRATFGLGHFDLFTLGYSQARFTTLAQVADLAGVYGLSFLVAMVNGVWADLYFAFKDHGWSPRRALARRRTVLSVAAVVATFGGLCVYGVARKASIRLEDGPRLAIVQPNVMHTMRNPAGVHLTQVLMTDAKVPAGAADLIVWPENAILDDIRREGVYLEDLRWLSQRKGAWFLVGGLSHSTGSPGRTTNAAFLVDDRGEIMGQYDKQVLFAWSEYVPIDGLLGRLSPSAQRFHRRLVRKGWGYMPTGLAGEEMTLLRFPWRNETLPFAALICGENNYPPLPAEAGRRGARFLVNITSEGEIGGPIQEQLLRICILRAIENRLSYVRVGNTGISCFIDPVGRMQSLLRGERGRTIFDSGVLIDQVALTTGGTTVYAASRDAFAIACVVLTLALFAFALVTRRGRAAVPAACLVAGLVLASPGCGGPPDLGIDPEGAREALDRGRKLYEERHPGEAIGELAAACAEPEACRAAMGYLAECFVATRQPENGSDFFGEVIERYPALEGEARGYRGYLLEKSLDLREAEAEYRAALAASPTVRAYGLLGRVLWRMGRTNDAVEILRKGVAAYPRDLRLRFLLGRGLRVQGDLDGAQAVFESILRDDPRHGHAWTNLGRIHAARGKDSLAESAFHRAIAVDPRNIEARLMLARSAIRTGDVEQAKRWLGEIMEIEATLGRGPMEE